MIYIFDSWLIHSLLFLLLFDILEVWGRYRVSLCWTGAWHTPGWHYYQSSMLAHLAKCPYSRLHTALRKHSFCLDCHSLQKWNYARDFFWHDESACGVCVCVSMCLAYDSSGPCLCIMIRRKAIPFTYLESCPVQGIWPHWVLYLMQGGLVSSLSHQSIKLLHEVQTSKRMPLLRRGQEAKEDKRKW